MSIAPVVIEFLAKGTPRISDSLRNVSDSIAKAERKAQQDAERGAKARERIATQEARLKVQAWLRADREVAKIQDRTVRETEKAAKAQERALDRSAREKVRIESQAAREVERIQERAHRNALRTLQAEERERNRSADRWVRQREREQRSDSGKRAAFVNQIVGAGAQGVRAGAARVAGLAQQTAGVAIQLGGGFSVGDAVARRAEMDRSAALLANSALGVNGVTKADVDPKKIIARAQAASVATGVDANELIGATQAYVAKSSDFAGGMGNMEFFGKLSKSTGAELKDIANAAGLIRSQNKDLDTEGMKSMLLAVVKQGQQGSVELSDLAKSAGKMTRSATSFAGDQSVNQQRLLGLSQLAVRTTGSPEGAAVAISALGSDTRGHQKELSRALGYDVLDKGGKITKSPEELLADLMGATGGNLAALGQRGGLGFTKPTMKIFEALKPEFDKAQAAYLKANPGDAKGANKAGAKAALEEMRAVTGSTMSMGQLDDMHGRVMGSSAEKFEAAVRQLRTAVGEELLPEFLKLVPVIKESTPAFVSLLKNGVPAFVSLIESVSSFVNANKGLIADIAAHPVGAIMAYEVTKSIAAAAIGETVKNTIARMISGAAGGGGGAPVPGGAAGAGAMGGVALAGGIAQGAALYNIYSATRGAQEEGAQGGRAAATAAMNGDAAAQKAIEEARGKSGTTEQASAWIQRAGATVSTLVNPLSYLTTMATDAGVEALGGQGQNARATETIKAAEFAKAADDVMGPLRKLSEAASTAATSLNAVSSGPNGTGRTEPIINR